MCPSPRVEFERKLLIYKDKTLKFPCVAITFFLERGIFFALSLKLYLFDKVLSSTRRTF